MIVVERAPPYLTIQDLGRYGYRATGVPVAGAMDQWSIAFANALVGNDVGAAALEWAIGAGSLRFVDDAIIAITGAAVEATLDERSITSASVIHARAGELLTIQRLIDLRFAYVAIAGGIDCPEVLGSRSTYLPAALGGIEGRRLKAQDHILTGPSRFAGENEDIARNLSNAAPDFASEEIRVIPADTDAFASVARSSYRVSQLSDRMGYRLEAEGDVVSKGASVTSEPVCPGVIQVPPDGQPIVLMADSPTVGGYLVAGTVISADLPILAQRMPGSRVRFVAVS
jgi:antagonist of KipI